MDMGRCRLVLEQSKVAAWAPAEAKETGAFPSGLSGGSQERKRRRNSANAYLRE